MTNPESKVENPKSHGRWLGVDFGSKWVGVAIGDPSGLCFPLTVLEAKPDQKLLDSLRKLAKQEDIAGFVVGLPLNMDGSEGSAARICRDFAVRLASHTGLEAALFDERLSSWEAEGRLIDAGMKPSERKQRVHAVAAQMILEGYFKRVQGPREGPSQKPA